MKRTSKTKSVSSEVSIISTSSFNGSGVHEISELSDSSLDPTNFVIKPKDYFELSNSGEWDQERESNYALYSRLEGYDSEDKRASSVLSKQNGSPPGTTFKFYKQFNDYWNVFPKTDYTYSSTSKFYKKEIAPGIPVIPNLSRKPLHPESFRGSIGIAPSQRIHSTQNTQSKLKRIVTTITTIITTTVTTTVTFVKDAIIHPTTKSPLRAFLLLCLLALPLFYYLSYQDQNENSFIRLNFINGSAFSQTKGALQELVGAYKWLYSLLGEILFLIINTITMVPVFITQSYYIITTYLNAIYHNTSQSYTSPKIKTDTISLQNFKTDPVAIKNIVYQVLAEKNIKATDFDTDPVKDVIKNNVIELYETTKRDLNQVVAEAKMVITHHLKKHEYKVVAYMKGVTEKFERELLQQKDNIKSLKPQIESLEEKIKNTHVQPTSKIGELQNVDASYQLSASVRQELADLVDNALITYHADRTGKADYALMSNGGMIISVKCTQTYTKKPGVMTILGLGFYDVYSDPEVIIKPGIFPGECWAFEGSEGYVVIKLAIPIHVTAVTMEHTPKELTPQGNIKSAPKQFSVWALKEAFDFYPEFLGRFVFLDEKASLQTFNIEPTSAATEMIELRIESNHGHPEYTCLYRFRVHGLPLD